MIPRRRSLPIRLLRAWRLQILRSVRYCRDHRDELQW